MISTLKDVLHNQVHNSHVPLKVLAERLNISYSLLANATNPNLEDFQFQLRNLIPLVQNTEDYQVLDYIEASVGRVAIELPAGGDPQEIHLELCKTIKEFGDLTGAAGLAMEDNKITVMEAKDLERETLALVSQAFSFLRAIKEAV